MFVAVVIYYNEDGSCFYSKLNTTTEKHSFKYTNLKCLLVSSKFHKDLNEYLKNVNVQYSVENRFANSRLNLTAMAIDFLHKID